jgi:phosphoserine phosphatase
MPSAAFFVLDRAVTAVPATRAFGRAALRHGMAPRGRLLQRSWTPAGAGDRFLANVLDTLGGHATADLDLLVPEVLAGVLDGIYPGMHTRIVAHETAGVPTWLCSAAPQAVVSRAAAALGMSGGALGTEIALTPEGRFTTQLAAPYCHGDGRAEWVHKVVLDQGLDPADCWAYSSSIEDLPLLGTVGHPVAVNPDRQLATAASGAGWEILRFTPAHTMRATVAAGAAVGGIAAAAAVLWLARRPGA